jgi:phage terminase Nu1 subunit (DNA packaging protein)
MVYRINQEKETLAKFLIKEIRMQPIYLTDMEKRRLTKEQAEIWKLKNRIMHTQMIFQRTKLPTQRTMAKT